MGKKKRAESEAEAQPEDNKVDIANGDSHKKEKKKKHKVDGAAVIRTVSVAVPGSIIDNTQSLELATRLASQIARAATIFRIDERTISGEVPTKMLLQEALPSWKSTWIVVIFDNKSESGSLPEADSDENESGAAFLVRILRYLETPQYLRKALFPKHNSLRYVGMLPPLDAPHHLRKHEWGLFREGVTLKERPPNLVGTLVDVGLSKNVIVDQVLDPGTRVTVAMGASWNLDADISRQVVSSSKPREEAGTYWGYKVRYASNITSVMNECPYKGGYDHSIGTSEHGQIINSSDLTIPTFRLWLYLLWNFSLFQSVNLFLDAHSFRDMEKNNMILVPFLFYRHLLIAFGGLAGLEESVEEDANLKAKNVREVFDLYLNTCPHQGSRTIRTEEAILISLQYFQEPISRALKRTH
ncbi:hypothetical protein C1H46_024122 [Malus baccata]|uniref:Uncharacterized protein n=1 Tax=Malus baccata TaxID=106549 RepID=A0A540LUX4_MALBA|nr:hypothetical protein C1H46_024122 [Malus baccata]